MQGAEELQGSKDIGHYQGCIVISCVRQIKGIKHNVNYLIAETCRYAKNDECPYPAKEKER